MEASTGDRIRSFFIGHNAPLQRTAFLCNVCGCPNFTARKKLTREGSSCFRCESNVRFRSLMAALSQKLYGRVLPLPLFPKNRAIRGLGMSDWPGYGAKLARKFDYLNSYFHKEPRLDITKLPAGWEGKFDFVVTSEVLEHIVPPVEIAFDNLFRLLKPGGALVLTVPFLPTGKTVEHFESLHQFEVIDEGEQKRLRNVTKAGDVQWFDNLVYHGGPGQTLEMRVFTLPSLLAQLRRAGFENIIPHGKALPAFGIPATSRSFPISARRPI